MYMCNCPTCMSMRYVRSVSSEVKRQHWIPVEVELQTVVSLHVDAQMQIRVPRKSSQCSELLRHLSSLPMLVLNSEHSSWLCLVRASITGLMPHTTILASKCF